MENHPIAYRQLLSYVDELNESIGSLAMAIEKQMKNRRYTPIARVGRQCYWQITSAVDRPTGWRLKSVTRFLVPAECNSTDHCLMYQVLIDSESAFDFPTILCARVEHPAFSEEQIYLEVWRSDEFATLHAARCNWNSLGEENGWFLAKPAYKTPVTRTKGFLLSLLDVNSVSLVSEKIVEPLIHSGDPGWRLGIGQLPVPGFCPSHEDTTPYQGRGSAEN